MSNNNENEQMCSICQNTTEGSIHKLECGHEFHPTCIITWFRSGYTECPMCRQYPERLFHGWGCVRRRIQF